MLTYWSCISSHTKLWTLVVLGIDTSTHRYIQLDLLHIVLDEEE